MKVELSRTGRAGSKYLGLRCLFSCRLLHCYILCKLTPPLRPPLRLSSPLRVHHRPIYCKHATPLKTQAAYDSSWLSLIGARRADVGGAYWRSWFERSIMVDNGRWGGCGRETVADNEGTVHFLSFLFIVCFCRSVYVHPVFVWRAVIFVCVLEGEGTKNIKICSPWRSNSLHTASILPWNSQKKKKTTKWSILICGNNFIPFHSFIFVSSFGKILDAWFPLFTASRTRLAKCFVVWTVI